METPGGSLLNLDVNVFVKDMIDAARRWLTDAQSTATFQANYPRFLQRYPTGLAPFITGPHQLAWPRFSDIAYSASPTALRASRRSRKSSHLLSFPSR